MRRTTERRRQMIGRRSPQVGEGDEKKGDEQERGDDQKRGDEQERVMSR